MFHLFGHGDPAVHALLIDGEGRRREGWIGERTDGYGDGVLVTCQTIEDRRATGRTKVERDPCSFVSDADVLGAPARDGHGASWEPRLSAKHAASSALAGQAVAYGNSDRLGLNLSLKLTATAAGLTECHGAVKGVGATPNV